MPEFLRPQRYGKTGGAAARKRTIYKWTDAGRLRGCGLWVQGPTLVPAAPGYRAAGPPAGHGAGGTRPCASGSPCAAVTGSNNLTVWFTDAALARC